MNKKNNYYIINMLNGVYKKYNKSMNIYMNILVVTTFNNKLESHMLIDLEKPIIGLFQLKVYNEDTGMYDKIFN